MNISHFSASTDVVVIGSNPEMADYVNQQGHIFGIAGYVVAEDTEGNRKRWHVVTLHHSQEAEVFARVEKQVNALTTRLSQGKNPVAFDRWEETFPAYGSDAYSEEDTIEWERSMER